MDRTHLIAGHLGGPGDDLANLVPTPVNFNRSVMRRSELAVVRQLRAGNEMFLRVAPEYIGKALVPHTVRFEAFIIKDDQYIRMLHQLLPVRQVLC